MNKTQKLQELLADLKHREPSFVFIIGVSGAGKTTLLKYLEKKISCDLISFNYFDSIGIPSTEEMVKKWGSGTKWQEIATHEWVERLSKIKDKKVIILEGSFDPDFAIQKLKDLKIKNYLILCLHAERKMREQRLILGRNQPELVTEDMENWAQFLKNKTLILGGTVINSEADGVEECANKIAEILLRTLSNPSCEGMRD